MITVTLEVAESLLGVCQFCQSGNLLSAPKKDGGRYFVNPSTGEPHFLTCKKHPRYVAPAKAPRKEKAPKAEKPKAEKPEEKPKPKRGRPKKTD